MTPDFTIGGVPYRLARWLRQDGATVAVAREYVRCTTCHKGIRPEQTYIATEDWRSCAHCAKWHGLIEPVPMATKREATSR